MKQKGFSYLFKIIVKVIIMAIISFITWMNATPGYFQETCTCKLQYMTDSEAESMRNGICSVIGVCRETRESLMLNKVLYLTSKLDFYKQ